MTDLPPPVGPFDAPPPGYVAFRPGPGPGSPMMAIAHGAPGRGAVFGQLLWRSIVVAIAGGAAVGIVFVVIGAFVDSSSDFAGYSIAAAFVGAVLGLILGVPAGLLIGGVGAAVLVPYRGRSFTHRYARIASTIAVGVFLAWLFHDSTGSTDAGWLALIVAPSLLGAWFGSLFLVRWYSVRMGG